MKPSERIRKLSRPEHIRFPEDAAELLIIANEVAQLEVDSIARNKLRPVVINGHQEHWRGYFHDWCGLSEYPKAIVEHEDGRITVEAAHKVQFADALKEGGR